MWLKADFLQQLLHKTSISTVFFFSFFSFFFFFFFFFFHSCSCFHLQLDQSVEHELKMEIDICGEKGVRSPLHGLLEFDS